MKPASVTKKRPTRPAGRRRRRSPRRSSRRWWIAAMTFVAVMAVAAAWIAADRYRGEPRWVRIPRGATAADVADSLKAQLGEGVGGRVAAAWRLMGGSAERARGAYLVEDGRGVTALAWAMSRGRQTPVKLTLSGARRLDDLIGRMAAQLEPDADEIAEACGRVLPAMGYGDKAEYVAAFIPDTYEFYYTVSADTLVSRLARATARFWTAERLRRARELGLTPTGVATIASIVEEETARPDERPSVARLYINRLQRGMRLQADPTVKYAVGDPSLRRITSEHLKVASPYNTYLHAGLPPGPIRVAERRTLIDVLEAPEGDWLYMCAREDFSGYHNFATDYATHAANARRYRAELDRRKIY